MFRAAARPRAESFARRCGISGRKLFCWIRRGRQTRNPDDFSRRINAGADWAAAAADAAVFVCNPIWRREDEDFLSRLPSSLPVVAAVNKIDLVQNKRDLLPFADALQQRHNFAAIVPVSASRGIGVDILADELAMLLPKIAAAVFGFRFRLGFEFGDRRKTPPAFCNGSGVG